MFSRDLTIAKYDADLFAAMFSRDLTIAKYDGFYKKQAGIRGIDPERISYLGDSPSSETIGLRAGGGTPPGMKAVYSNTGKVKYVPIE